MTEQTDWRLSWIRRLQVRMIAAVGYPVVGLLGHTWRWRVSGLHHLERVIQEGRQPILAFWHGRILAATYFFRRRGIVVITSENFDGEWIARIIERFGYGTARGSTSRGAQRALIQLTREMRAGRAVGFTLDGPRGPYRHAQAGAVWLAKKTGNPIVPFHLEAARHWTTRSWDRGQVPKPFGPIALAVGAPVEVSASVDAREMEVARASLEVALTELERTALDLVREGGRVSRANG